MAMVVGYGCGFGLMSSTWGICFNVLLVGASELGLLLGAGLLSRALRCADLFGMEMLATLAGTLEWFNLTGMASGPVTHSVIYEATGQSFRIPLLIMAASNGA